MSNDNDKYILQSVSNALEILDILGQHRDLSVPELTKISGFGKSSVFRILATLESKNYVKKTQDARYSLDIKLAYLGQSVNNHNDLIKYGHPFLERLTSSSGETSHLGVIYRSIYMRFIDKVVSSATIHMDSHLGFYRLAHHVACGKAVLAFSTCIVQSSYINSVSFDLLTQNSIPCGDALRLELEDIRHKGYSLDREESEYGLTCIAAPIFDSMKNVLAAVSISGPTDRLIRNLEKNIELVTEAGANISKALATPHD